MDEIPLNSEYQPRPSIKVLSSEQNPDSKANLPTFNTVFDNPTYNIPNAFFRIPSGIKVEIVEDEWEEDGEKIVERTGIAKATISRVEEKFISQGESERINGYTLLGGGKALQIFLVEDGGKTPIALDFYTRRDIKKGLNPRQQEVYQGIPVQFEAGDEIEFDINMDTGHISVLPPIKRMDIILDKYNQTTKELKGKV